MPLFDPETGKVLDPDALRSVQFNAMPTRKARSVVKDGKKITERQNLRTGQFRKGDINVEHPSGRVDQHISINKGHKDRSGQFVAKDHNWVSYD